MYLFASMSAYNKNIAFFKRKEILMVDEKLTVYNNIKYKIVNRQTEPPLILQKAFHYSKIVEIFWKKQAIQIQTVPN